MEDSKTGQDNGVDFLFKKTNLPRDVVKILADIEVPNHWTERIKTILENFNRPESLQLLQKMIDERADIVWNLPVEELLETEDQIILNEYIDELQNKGGATLKNAKIFAAAMLEAHLHVEDLIFEALTRSQKKKIR